jgi:hypothetical protein
MNENNFWTSEKQLLTTDWKKPFPLTSPTRRISSFHWNRPRSMSFAEEKKGTQIGDPSEKPEASE